MNAFTPLSQQLLDQDQLDELIETVGFEPFIGFLQDFIEELRLRPGVIGAHFASGDREATRASAHYLKGPALSVGATRIASLSSAIEQAPEAETADLIADLQEASLETEQALRALMCA